MGISGFPIERSAARTVITNEPWFSSNVVTIASVADDGGAAEFTTSTPHGFVVGQLVSVNAGANYNFRNEAVVTVDSVTEFTTAVAFVDNVTGIAYVDDSIPWDEDTPENVLREIHVQFDTNLSTIVEVTLDGGVTYMPINNNDPLFGLATFTMFVVKNTLLNFRSQAVRFAIVVTAA